MARRNPLRKATKVIGGRKHVAHLCDVSYSAVQQWEENGVPRDHIIRIAEATEKKAKKPEDAVDPLDLLRWSTRQAERATA